jgi:hypothetical protein
MKKRFLPISLFALITSVALAAQLPSPAAGLSGKKAEPSMMGMGKENRNAEPISGKVLETMNNGGYSYIHLQKKSGDKIWVAVMETPVKIGSQMSFNPGLAMSNFESKGLKRTFDSIIFTDSLTTSASDIKKMQAASPGSKGSVVAKEEKILVAKATGPDAVTVEETFKNSAKLDKKRVVVRGKVVKVSSGIMKLNWIHIQDGTGSQKKGTNNLVCTSKNVAVVGDIVTVIGTLAKNRDFGSGYRYKAIVENATFKK